MRQVMLLVLIWIASAAAASASASEDWKGQEDPRTMGVGVLTGLGIIDNRAGFALLGSVAGKIVTNGFVPEITNSVWAEAELGSLFGTGSTLFTYGAHLRWDFEKNADWTLYALGGVGGNISEGRFPFFPRFGLGAFHSITDSVRLRGEVSHELIAFGFAFPL